MKATDISEKSAAEVIELLDLAPHPEGGHYRETFREQAADGERAASTAIFFLLQEGEISAWHRADATEMWHWYAGAPLELNISNDRDESSLQTVGADLDHGQIPQGIVPPNYWQSARSLGKWTLAGCTVAPGFEFHNFELAPKGWQPK